MEAGFRKHNLDKNVTRGTVVTQHICRDILLYLETEGLPRATK
jgi:hypothetical protein